MAEPSFDRSACQACLSTRRLGRSLVVRAAVESTNDVAWEALASGLPDGTAVAADVQTRGRGRAGRAWHTSPGKGLALSVLLHRGCDAASGTRAGGSGLLPLAAGLALARGLERLAVRAELKWPNDLLLAGRKLAGILCESRRTTAGTEAAVIGVGVNVAQSPEDFPPELATTATSLAMEGCSAPRERVAAEFLNALEPLVTQLEEGGREALIEAWRARASFWGRMVRVRTAGGEVSGVARALGQDGALLIEREGGGSIAVLAGDLELPDSAGWGRA